MRQLGPVLYCGDPHGEFRHINDAALERQASAVVLLGDMEPEQPLHVELAPLIARQVPIYFIPGNHDADSDELWARVWRSELAGGNVHGKVVRLPDGTRLAGLGGVFRESVWYPEGGTLRNGEPRFRSRAEHADATPSWDRWQGGPPRKHWASIYPDEVDRLADLTADVLITHEAPGYHPLGFLLLDVLAQSMGVAVTVHGHHHDRLDSSKRWPSQGFKSFGVGLQGITAIDAGGNAEVIELGQLDYQRMRRRPAISDGWEVD